MDDEDISDIPGLLRYLDNRRESKTLNLSYKLPALPVEAFKEVIDFVKENPFVTVLDLRGNKIEAAGAALLAKTIKVNRSIQSLHLKWNAIGKDLAGLQSICAAMKSNLSIVQLDLRNNRINSEGAKMIAEMLGENTTLTHVDLAFNQIEVAGGVALLGAIKNNKTLVDVQLGGSKVGEEIVHEVAYLLRLNKKRRQQNAQAPDLPAAIAKFHEVTQEYVEAEQKRRQREGDDRPVVLEVPKGPFTAQYGNEIMLQLMMREREEVHPEDKAVYHLITDYIEKQLLDTAAHQKARVEAEEREYIDTLGFQEREERYIREVKDIEDALQQALAEKDQLMRVIKHREMEKKFAEDELAEAIEQNVLIEENGKVLEQDFKKEIRRLREENQLLEGKLALAEKDEALLVQEVDDLRVHQQKFQGDINLILGERPC